ncbi:MAG: carboxypeptidase regulatory-like domain-containing protein [Victivallales bacterium]|nr:carboxypeptidase regulatory-like domain-containing protein [Victivallales bacterium]
MFTEKMLKVIGCCLLSVAMMLTAIAQDDNDELKKKEGYEDLEYKRRMEEAAKDDREIDFYGKVVDEDGNPLQGVRVRLNVRSTHPVRLIVGKRFFRTTDGNGLFSVRNERGIRLIVGDLNLAGYHYRGKSRGYSYLNPDLAPEDERPPTNKDKPAVFAMRKIGQLMPLLKGEGGSTILTPAGAFHDIPLFNRLQLSTVFGKNYQDYRMPALQAKWGFAEDGQGWLVTIKGKHEGDEVLVSDQRFYEAPEEGYLPEATIPIPTPGGRYINVFICLRTARPITYSLVEVSIRPSIRPPPDDLRLHVKSLTNPYGTRSLEQAPSDNLYGGLARYNFEDEAYKAIANGENPRLPTEEELLEFKAKREKEEAESAARSSSP